MLEILRKVGELIAQAIVMETRKVVGLQTRDDKPYCLFLDVNALRAIPWDKRLRWLAQIARESHVLLPDEVGKRLTFGQLLAMERIRARTTEKLFENPETFIFDLETEGFDANGNLDVQAWWVPVSGGVKGKPRLMQITALDEGHQPVGHRVNEPDSPKTIPFSELAPWAGFGDAQEKLPEPDTMAFDLPQATVEAAEG